MTQKLNEFARKYPQEEHVHSPIMKNVTPRSGPSVAQPNQ
jgi:hypothetical protein